MIKKVFTSCFLVFFVVSYGIAAAPVAALGQVISNDVVMDGVRVPSGTTVLDKTQLDTSNDPAFIHLSNGQVVHLHRNSSAYLEEKALGTFQVSVRAGTMSYRTASGEVATAAPESVVVFAAEALPTASPQQTGLRVVLSQSASSGQNLISVNDATRIDPLQPILLQSPDGQTREIHYVEAFDEHTVRLTAPLQNNFGANSTVVQDANAVSQAMSSGVAVVGIAAGLSLGAIIGGVGTAAALSTVAVVGIVAAVAGAGVGIAAAAGAFDDESVVIPPPPQTSP